MDKLSGFIHKIENSLKSNAASSNDKEPEIEKV